MKNSIELPVNRKKTFRTGGTEPAKLVECFRIPDIFQIPICFFEIEERLANLQVGFAGIDIHLPVNKKGSITGNTPDGRMPGIYNLIQPA